MAESFACSISSLLLSSSNDACSFTAFISVIKLIRTSTSEQKSSKCDLGVSNGPSSLSIYVNPKISSQRRPILFDFTNPSDCLVRGVDQWYAVRTPKKQRSCAPKDLVFLRQGLCQSVVQCNSMKISYITR